VEQQSQPVVGEVAKAVPDPLDLLMWNGLVNVHAVLFPVLA
jgi:hypothetical protein